MGLLSVCSGRPDRSTGRREICFYPTLFKALISFYSFSPADISFPLHSKTLKIILQPSPLKFNFKSTLEFVGSSLSGLDLRLSQGFFGFYHLFSIILGKNLLFPGSCFISCSPSYSSLDLALILVRSSLYLDYLCGSCPSSIFS